MIDIKAQTAETMIALDLMVKICTLIGLGHLGVEIYIYIYGPGFSWPRSLHNVVAKGAFCRPR